MNKNCKLFDKKFRSCQYLSNLFKVLNIRITFCPILVYVYGTYESAIKTEESHDVIPANVRLPIFCLFKTLFYELDSRFPHDMGQDNPREAVLAACLWLFVVGTIQITKLTNPQSSWTSKYVHFKMYYSHLNN